jgi:hypothetical protein
MKYFIGIQGAVVHEKISQNRRAAALAADDENEVAAFAHGVR